MQPVIAVHQQISQPTRALHWIIFALAVIVFLPSLQNDFTGWDDTAYIIDNPLMQSLDGLQRIWFSRENEQYYPVTFTAFWLQYQIFGEHPLGYHIINIIVHAINSALVLIITRRLIGSNWLSAIAAILFAIHPVQAMTVAWIAQQKNLFACFFALLTMLAWLKNASARWLIIACMGYALTVLSKSAMIGLPLSLLAIDVLLRNQRSAKSLLRVSPMIAIAIGSALLTIFFEQKFVDAADPQSIPPAFERMLLAMATPWWYVKQLVWPVDLSPIYPIWDVSARDWRWWIAPLANVAVAIALLLWWKRTRSIAVAVTLWAAIHFFALLAPILGFIPYGNMHATPVSDHFLYVACIGPFALIGLFVSHVAGRVAKSAAIALAIILALQLTWLAIENARVYKNDESLWQRSLERAPNSYVAHLAMGTVWKNRGLESSNDDDFDRSLQSFAKAASIRPAMADAHWYAGEVLFELGEMQASETALRNALQRNPNLPKALLRLAAILEQTGRPNEALTMFERAIALDPNDAAARVRLGGMYIGFGRYDDAENQFRAAIEIDADQPMAYVGIATCQRARGEWPQVVANLRGGAAKVSDPISILNMLALTYATSPEDSVRDGAAAITIMEEIVLKRQIIDIELLNTLAASYAEAGRFEGAVQVSQKALEMAKQTNDARMITEIERRMTIYQRRQPLRWPFNASSN